MFASYRSPLAELARRADRLAVALKQQRAPSPSPAAELRIESSVALAFINAATLEDAADQITGAAELARRGGPKRPEPTGLAADILRAGCKRRREI